MGVFYIDCNSKLTVKLSLKTGHKEAYNFDSASLVMSSQTQQFSCHWSKSPLHQGSLTQATHHPPGKYTPSECRKLYDWHELTGRAHAHCGKSSTGIVSHNKKLPAVLCSSGTSSGTQPSSTT